jgi:hypothetical protein
MLVGLPPFADDGSVSVLLKHLNAPVPSITKYLGIENPVMEAFVAKALAKKPEDRFQTAQEFAQALKPVFGVQDTTATPTFLSPVPLPDPATAPMPVVKAMETPTADTPAATPVAAHRSPLGILAIAMTVIAVLATVGLLSRQQAASGKADSSEAGVESMTDNTSFYFTSTFDSGDSTLDDWPQQGNNLLIRELTGDGFYRFRNASPREAVTSIFNPAYVYANAVITMEATLEAESQVASGYGIVFRYMDEDNYNVFAVDGAGRYSIWVREDGEWRELRGERWTPDDAVQRLGETNLLTIQAIGDHFVGTVNGEVVAEVTDPTIPSGHIGVYLATTDSGTASVLIDSYSVTEATGDVPSMTETEATDEE